MVDQQFELVETLDQRADRDLALESREMGTEAKMRATAERQVVGNTGAAPSVAGIYEFPSFV